jgi:hypothetical protein
MIEIHSLCSHTLVLPAYEDVIDAMVPLIGRPDVAFR